MQVQPRHIKNTMQCTVRHISVRHKNTKYCILGNALIFDAIDGAI
jgi:hypothetical protein